MTIDNNNNKQSISYEIPLRRDKYFIVDYSAFLLGLVAVAFIWFLFFACLYIALTGGSL